MKIEIDKGKIKTFLESAIGVLLDTVYDALQQFISDVEKKGYADGIELGKNNTIFSLCETKISEDTMINLLNKYWEMPAPEATMRVQVIKEQVVQSKLEEYLTQQGWSSTNINEFLQSNTEKIHKNKQLWVYRFNPGKLLQELEKIKE